ncbi:MAG: hypothetical protein Q4P28_01890 [Tissierellia bacterium]|nr:hypothetical protein [Tissierellia bacterium]
MEYIQTNKAYKYFKYIMIVTQGIVLALVAIFYLNEAYLERILDYPKTGEKIKITGIDEERTDEIFSFIRDYVESKDMALIRTDLSSDKEWGNGIESGILKGEKMDAKELEFSFLDQKVLKEEELYRLLNQKSGDKIFGVEKVPSIVWEKFPTFVMKIKSLLKHYQS